MEVKVIGNVEVSKEEQNAYVKYVEDKYDKKVKSLTIKVDGDYVDLEYNFETVPFERIRRITGYLVGTMDKWNDAKTAEERDRVKHGTEMEKI